MRARTSLPLRSDLALLRSFMRPLALGGIGSAQSFFERSLREAPSVLAYEAIVVDEEHTMTQKKDALLWVDLEMTGLDSNACTIIEIAAIVTDSELNVLAEGPALVIHQDQATLDKMDAWNQAHHRKSGLYDSVLASTISLADAEQQVLDFSMHWLVARKAPLCGNSIWQDRRFLCRYMPKLENYLHYRNIDVSSFKECVRRWYPKGPEMVRKKESHRALDDIKESISELKFYRQHYWKALADVPVTS